MKTPPKRAIKWFYCVKPHGGAHSLIGFLLLAFLWPASFLMADTLFLKSGKSLQGKIVGQSRTRIKFKTARGIQTFPKSSVQRIRFNSNYGKTKAELEREARKKARIEQQRKKRQQERLQREEEARKKAKIEQERLQREEEARKKAKIEQERLQREEEARKKARIEQQRKAPSLTGALWRSALLPGWGQHYQGRKTFAWSYGAAFGGLALLDYFLFSTALASESSYIQIGDEFRILSPLLAGSNPASRLAAPADGALVLYYSNGLQNSRLRLEQSKGRLQTGLYLLGGLYLWNLADVVLYAPNRQSALLFQSGGPANGLLFSFRYRF